MQKYWSYQSGQESWITSCKQPQNISDPTYFTVGVVDFGHIWLIELVIIFFFLVSFIVAQIVL